MQTGNLRTEWMTVLSSASTRGRLSGVHCAKTEFTHVFSAGGQFVDIEASQSRSAVGVLVLKEYRCGRTEMSLGRSAL